MARSTDHYNRAVDYANLATLADGDPGLVASYAAAGQLHAMLADLTLKYEAQARYSDRTVYVQESTDREFSPLRITTHPEVTMKPEVGSPNPTPLDWPHIGDEPLTLDERTVPANAAAEALALPINAPGR